ncbi:unnamed protein product [Taenia asiatica]|uniref:Uncharacterized protein n=1 Tax=Taenia asiatica TaxID=60517 RepID=A0A0R3WH83_TAEAS|nr:unnamed protein product [Taenia asiatica]
MNITKNRPCPSFLTTENSRHPRSWLGGIQILFHSDSRTSIAVPKCLGEGKQILRAGDGGASQNLRASTPLRLGDTALQCEMQLQVLQQAPLRLARRQRSRSRPLRRHFTRSLLST